MSQDDDQVANAAIETTIFSLLAQRRPGTTICPSEVARALATDNADWRGLMPGIRQVAQSLASTNRLVFTRSGTPVDATAPGGPIRLGLPAAPHGSDPRERR
ncbi:DUF3253 domain-containing protein [Xylophilus sp. GOD-11R]|uniref:DUF3253 domain-containing protein n=1 Tax=Xylophilus sp. GOD-11R TaxID=3089814 RepID=UPI00298C23C8|nr:DUF3253 domain-containing protein [Xylophilus sp. GOD-11R]WPB58848.1 DUF3253 domain-containing protein [Xylophilus sp. GOD-11R]